MREPHPDPEPLFKILDNAMNEIRTYYILTVALKLELFNILQIPKNVEKLSREQRCDKKLISLFCRTLYDLKPISKERLLCDQ